MSYSNQTDILLQIDTVTLINLTDDIGSEQINNTAVIRSITDGDALIDSYLSAIYATPLTVIPDIIRKLSVDIAIYNLYSRRLDTIPDIRKDRYKRSLLILQEIADDKVKLAGITEVSDILVNTNAVDKIFTMGKVSNNSAGTLDDY